MTELEAKVLRTLNKDLQIIFTRKDADAKRAVTYVIKSARKKPKRTPKKPVKGLR